MHVWERVTAGRFCHGGKNSVICDSDLCGKISHSMFVQTHRSKALFVPVKDGKITK